MISTLTLSILNLPLSSSSTTSRNSRLVVDEDDLKWVAIEKNILLLLEQFHENFRCKPLRCRQLNNSSERQNNGGFLGGVHINDRRYCRCYRLAMSTWCLLNPKVSGGRRCCSMSTSRDWDWRRCWSSWPSSTAHWRNTPGKNWPPPPVTTPIWWTLIKTKVRFAPELGLRI